LVLKWKSDNGVVMGCVVGKKESVVNSPPNNAMSSSEEEEDPRLSEVLQAVMQCESELF
jgi:hypothetical protein